MSRCAMCAAPADIPATDVVSANFTDWDLWRSRGTDPRPMLCGLCAARYRDTDLRRYPHTVTDTSHSRLTLLECADLLSRPLPADVAVIVPVGGRKHLWHSCRGGHVTSDQVPARLWDGACAVRLRTVAELRATDVVGSAAGSAQAGRPAEVIYGRLVQQTGQLGALDSDGVLDGDGGLVLGLVCELSDRCLFEWRSA